MYTTPSSVCAFTVCFSPSRYTGKERDTESGLDYFGARYYASSMGRFMSPDWSAKEDPVPYAQLDDPQSLNLYSYVRNNPLTRVDADGHCCDLDSFIIATSSALGTVGGLQIGSSLGLALGTAAKPGGGSVAGALELGALGGATGNMMGNSLGKAIVNIYKSANSNEPAPAAPSGEDQTQTGGNDHAGQGVQKGSKDRTAQGTKDQVEGIGNHQKEMTKKAKGNAAADDGKKMRYRPNDTKSLQNEKTKNKQIKSQADADAANHD